MPRLDALARVSPAPLLAPRTGTNVVEHGAQPGRRKTDPGVGRSVVHANLVAEFVDDPAAREHDMANVTIALVGLTRAEGPLVASAEHDRGILEIQEREADTIDRSAGSAVGAVVQDEPVGVENSDSIMPRLCGTRG